MKWKKGKVTEIEEAVLSLISSKITELSWGLWRQNLCWWESIDARVSFGGTFFLDFIFLQENKRKEKRMKNLALLKENIRINPKCYKNDVMDQLNIKKLDQWQQHEHYYLQEQHNLRLVPLKEL